MNGMAGAGGGDEFDGVLGTVGGGFGLDVEGDDFAAEFAHAGVEEGGDHGIGAAGDAEVDFVEGLGFDGAGEFGGVEVGAVEGEGVGGAVAATGEGRRRGL